MTASSRGTRAAVSLIRLSGGPRVCSSCLKTINRLPASRRTYAAAATALKPLSTPNTDVPKFQGMKAAGAAAPEYTIQSGVLLSRPPILTRTSTDFEKAFFFYQKRLNERLVMPFTRYFYFKKDTPADADWKIKAKERNYQPARELGGYNAYSDMGWNDELLVGDNLSDTSSMVEALVKDSQVMAVEGKDGKAMEVVGTEAEIHEGGKIEMPLSRVTAADLEKDYKRLDRQLERTLYLCVKRENGGWGFPAGPLEGRENLYQAAERVLSQAAGENMNTWLVGHAPVGHHISLPRYVLSSEQPASKAPVAKKSDNPATTESEVSPAVSKSAAASERRRLAREADAAAKASGQPPVKSGSKTFFMKGRIMAGQANLQGNAFGLNEFRWLTKEEIQKLFEPKYYSSVKDMLAER